MASNIIDGRKVAQEIEEHIKSKINCYLATGARKPKLSVIIVGDDPASILYVKNKQLACRRVGIEANIHPLTANATEDELICLVRSLNNDSATDGILIQLPLPQLINSFRVLSVISLEKDVDGLSPLSLGRLSQRHPLYKPCTPVGIVYILNKLKVPLEGAYTVIVGDSNIVGRPLALELLNLGSTVTITHRFTKDLAQIIAQADILISAVGKPHLISGTWIKPGAVVIDVGINKVDGRVVGDVEFLQAQKKAKWITPVPGGVGPLTIAALLHNTTCAYQCNVGNLPGQLSQGSDDSLEYLQV